MASGRITDKACAAAHRPLAALSADPTRSTHGDGAKNWHHAERPLARDERLSPRWDIYLVRSTPAQLLGAVEAPNADAAIEAAVRVFSVNHEHTKRLVAVLKSRSPRPRERL